MKVVNKLVVNGMTLLTLDENILDINADKVIIDGKKYDYDIAYDMTNTTGIKTTGIESDVVDFTV